MILKELLTNTDIEKVTDIILKTQKVNSTRKKLLKNIENVVNEFKTIEPLYNEKNFTIFVDQYRDFLYDNGKDISTYFCVDGYYIDDILEHKEDLDKTDFSGELHICPYGLDFISRKELAGFNICELSIDKYGIDRVIAEIIWEITFYGWDEETIDQHAKELDESLQGTKDHPEDLRPISELFEKLGWEDERTEEEIEADLKLSKEIGLENFRNRNAFLKEYKLENYQDFLKRINCKLFK